ncbi:lysophospholipase [Idiomarina fontislapidosi]|uniref:Lysophospholipase n=1 Tax=Idiomarina fontislapidosi TaxID=263723 RepID=A0A432XN06_9GAMM|nr:alpha/beta fold hydrolase [Idiomarina fontislapidosi]PYE30333.1 lysophospholipase [Idiomarina fontislapidosi]RUO50077.1 lysophospholipase [Idiomarina fontislapidosi]
MIRPADNEPEWLEFYHQHIAPFWAESVEHIYLDAADGLRLFYAYHKVSETAPLLVISTGRIEAAIKYQEVIWELAQQGISCAVIDHRGQGLSGRMTENSHQGHVARFRDFIDDFSVFMNDIDERFPKASRYALGHSMGGAILSWACCEQDFQFKHLFLTAPMMGIRTAGIPAAIARAIAGAGRWLNETISPEKPWYFLGMKDYIAIPFAENVLTHSEQRYQVFREAYENEPRVKLGGPTFAWLHEALTTCKQLQSMGHQLKVTATLFNAGADVVVSEKAQRRFAAGAGTRVEFRAIEGAKHELMMESDRYRQPIMEAVLTRLKSSVAQ